MSADMAHSRSVNFLTTGVCSFAAPVFDYYGNFVLGITLMGRSAVFDQDWNGPQANAVKACAAAVSVRLGYQPTRPV
jgi:DNA-binding IclR family transcriptional regulator